MEMCMQVSTLVVFYEFKLFMGVYTKCLECLYVYGDYRPIWATHHQERTGIGCDAFLNPLWPNLTSLTT